MFYINLNRNGMDNIVTVFIIEHFGEGRNRKLGKNPPPCTCEGKMGDLVFIDQFFFAWP